MKASRCHICLGDIREGLDRVTCVCGREYHETCASKVAVCPVCRSTLVNPVAD